SSIAPSPSAAPSTASRVPPPRVSLPRVSLPCISSERTRVATPPSTVATAHHPFRSGLPRGHHRVPDRGTSPRHHHRGAVGPAAATAEGLGVSESVGFAG